MGLRMLLTGNLVMKKKKEKKINQEVGINLPAADEHLNESPQKERIDPNSIEEFIEFKKLQNRLLKEMLNNIKKSGETDN